MPVGGLEFSANNRSIAASVSGAGCRFHSHQIGHHRQPLRVSVRTSIPAAAGEQGELRRLGAPPANTYADLQTLYRAMTAHALNKVFGEPADKP